MYAHMRKRTLAKLKQAEKKGLPAHDSECINDWIRRAEFLRKEAKDKTIRFDGVRRNSYKSALQYLIICQRLLYYFEQSVREQPHGTTR